MHRTVLLCSVLSACVGPLGPREPLVHRASGATCDMERPTWPVDELQDEYSYVPSDCEDHEDCTEGIEGRCATTSGREGTWLTCTYSECETDGDCGDGVCRCAGDAFDSHNVCLPAGNCQTDDDCGNDFCSPSVTSCGPGWGLLGHFCHTTFDGCRDDDDCGEGGYCAYEEGVQRWTCMSSICVG